MFARLLAVPALLALAPTASPAVQDVQLVPEGAVWRYLDNGSNQGTAWREPGFNDAGWKSGPAKLGYGDGDIVTEVSYGFFSFLKYITTYFRHEFVVDDPTELSTLRLRMQRDDGAVVFLNGVEVVRSNFLPLIDINSGTWALESINGSDETFWHEWTVPSSLLVPGENTLAVEIHQVGPTSSDIGMDLELYAETGSSLTRGPYLQRGNWESMRMRWRTSSSTIGRVVVTDASGAPVGTFDEGAATTEHAVDAIGLEPDTEYRYTVGFGSTVLSGPHTFRTAPLPGTDRPVRVWIIGDSGTANANAAAVRDAYQGYAAGERTDVWLMLGDNAYDNGTDSEYQAAVFDMYPELLATTPVWPTRGNHELSASTYYGIFSLPMAAQAGGQPSGTEAYYSFDFGPVHFVCLDSFISPYLAGSAMLDWLTADLSSTTQPWIVAYFHHPPYSKGSHDSDLEPDLGLIRSVFVPVLEDFGVDLVFSGHSHAYERSYLIDGHYGFSWTFGPEHMKDPGDGSPSGDGAYAKAPIPHAGTVYTVAGNGGKTSGGSFDHDAMSYSVSELGSVVLDVDGPTLDLRFLDAEGNIDDHVRFEKHAIAGLAGSTTTLDVSSGGTQTLTLDATPSFAGQAYLLLGSATGTSPGTPVGDLTLPLAFDSYTNLTLGGPDFLPGAFGLLDGSGDATAAVTLPGGSSSSLIGTTLFHAFVTIDLGPACFGCPSFVSNPFPLTFLP
ncbi:MAG: metallophosphoesterase family protein [Planctomycetota bacterium]